MMIELPQIPLSEADAERLRQWADNYKQSVLESLAPTPDALGLRKLPREQGNPNKFLRTFKTDSHTYTIIGDDGIGFERYTVFQKLGLQRGFGRDFEQVNAALEQIKMGIAGETTVAKLRSEAIVAITGLQHSVADFGSEQFDAALWLCTLFVLREDEKVNTYSKEIAEEKIKDWASYGYSELDFFFLSGNMVPAYGKAFQNAMNQNERARQQLLDAMSIGGRPLKANAAS